MQTSWQYRTVPIERPLRVEIDEMLFVNGADGWILCGIVPEPMLAVFRRPDHEKELDIDSLFRFAEWASSEGWKFWNGSWSKPSYIHKTTQELYKDFRRRTGSG